jgi:nicotinate-nucleotide pyrophosphorylase (carboxylating)
MEDIGRGDWTAQLVPAGRRVTGARGGQGGGGDLRPALVRRLRAGAGPERQLTWPVAEGQAVQAGTEVVCRIQADARALLRPSGRR